MWTVGEPYPETTPITYPSGESLESPRLTTTLLVEGRGPGLSGNDRLSEDPWTGVSSRVLFLLRDLEC